MASPEDPQKKQSKHPQTDRQIRGQWAEQLALAHLCKHGLRLLQNNFRCKLGEIDLIMQDRSGVHRRILVFVEVRYRHTNRYGGAAASVNAGKQQKIVRTAQLYQRQHQRLRSWPARFDVVAVHGSRQQPRLRWIKSAFDQIHR